MSRSATQQQLPDGRNLSGFPATTRGTADTFYRQHSAEHGAWFYSSSGQGRFDLPDPRGTVYLAEAAEDAVREGVGPDLVRRGYVPESVVAGRVLSTLHLPAPARAADLTDGGVLAWGVVANELCSMSPYGVPRAWALAFADAGFDGISGSLRFGGPSSRGLSLFGPAGPADHPADPAPRPLRSVVRAMGIKVAHAPSKSGLTIS